jgi:peptidoglycan/LPS O-acetylase OafA/YrhL
MDSHLRALDGLRALAALMVVLTHVGFLSGAVAYGLGGRLLGRGDFGVGIFFGLSGFLLHRAMLRETQRNGHVAMGSYLLRRSARVLPAYWLCLAVVCLAVRPDWQLTTVNIMVAQIYVPDALLHAFTQTWSLSTEISFYLLLPLVFVALQRARARGNPYPFAILLVTGALGLVAAGAVSQVLISDQALIGRWLPAYWSTFALGMILAEAQQAPQSRQATFLRGLAQYPGTCVATAAAAYLLATTFVAGPLILGPVTGLQLSIKLALSCVVTAGLMVPLVFGSGTDPLARSLASRVGRYFGDISYGIFLWHLPVFEGLYAVTGLPYFTGGAMALLAVGLPVTILLAALSHHFLEAPLMAWAHHPTSPRMAWAHHRTSPRR